MLCLSFAIILRILSNSSLNVFQKILSAKGEFSSVINFYTYLGLTAICVFIQPQIIYNFEIALNVLLMGFLGALGNYFIIKALSCGELSSLAPINSYKPIVALIFGMILLKEFPGMKELVGIFLIIVGTLILFKGNIIYNRACLFRFYALIFSGIEAIFIKKVILLTNVSTAFFYWACASLIFAILFALISKHELIIKKDNIRYQIILVVLVALMQYSTNYVFSKINVSYALALFQLSTILSVFLGVNIFKEKEFFRKIIASLVMILGAILIILF